MYLNIFIYCFIGAMFILPAITMVINIFRPFKKEKTVDTICIIGWIIALVIIISSVSSCITSDIIKSTTQHNNINVLKSNEMVATNADFEFDIDSDYIPGHNIDIFVGNLEEEKYYICVLKSVSGNCVKDFGFEQSEEDYCSWYSTLPKNIKAGKYYIYVSGNGLADRKEIYIN